MVMMMMTMMMWAQVDTMQISTHLQTESVGQRAARYREDCVCLSRTSAKPRKAKQC